MVQSKAENVDSYMDSVDPDRREALDRLRALCREHLDGWDERMQWGMPGYGPPGSDNVVSFNSQKRHIAFYAGATAVERFADRLRSADCGKGCIRYARPDVIDFAAVEEILRDIRARGEAIG